MLSLAGVLRRCAEFSAGIQSPAVCGTLGRECTGVVSAGGDRYEPARRLPLGGGAERWSCDEPRDDSQDLSHANHGAPLDEQGGI